MCRPQFSLKTMLWLTLVVAAFFAGMALEKRLDHNRREAKYLGIWMKEREDRTD